MYIHQPKGKNVFPRSVEEQELYINSRDMGINIVTQINPLSSVKEMPKELYSFSTKTDAKNELENLKKIHEDKFNHLFNIQTKTKPVTYTYVDMPKESPEDLLGRDLLSATKPPCNTNPSYMPFTGNHNYSIFDGSDNVFDYSNYGNYDSSYNSAILNTFDNGTLRTGVYLKPRQNKEDKKNKEDKENEDDVCECVICLAQKEKISKVDVEKEVEVEKEKEVDIEIEVDNTADYEELDEVDYVNIDDKEFQELKRIKEFVETLDYKNKQTKVKENIVKHEEINNNLLVMKNTGLVVDEIIAENNNKLKEYVDELILLNHKMSMLKRIVQVSSR